MEYRLKARVYQKICMITALLSLLALIVGIIFSHQSFSIVLFFVFLISGYLSIHFLTRRNQALRLAKQEERHVDWNKWSGH